eukprot:3566610-Amphidinium_carterae.1
MSVELQDKPAGYVGARTAKRFITKCYECVVLWSAPTRDATPELPQEPRRLQARPSRRQVTRRLFNIFR